MGRNVSTTADRDHLQLVGTGARLNFMPIQKRKSQTAVADFQKYEPRTRRWPSSLSQTSVPRGKILYAPQLRQGAMHRRQV
jgi:hypothetical protein